MGFEGDLKRARFQLFNRKPSNLLFLLGKRYKWMNYYLEGKKSIYELGCGAGFSKPFISNKNLSLTDVTDYEWVDLHIDALNLPFSANSVDAFICSHMIHHLANPYNFLNSALNCLKPGGLIIISEVNTSVSLRMILRLMRHEGWSYEVDVYSPDSICNDSSDPWSANCSIPQMLFEDSNRFEKVFTNSKIIHSKLTEFLIFPLSGGVISKSKTINLPIFILKIIHILDTILIKLFPSFFPLGMEIVIQKKYS
tara:strand:+ start:493 stop:1251 length:759 start_codon:yes stop_codon:yes gene_type:complete